MMVYWVGASHDGILGGAFKILPISFTPRCHISVSCINEYLDIDSGGYVNKYFSCSDCSMAECFPEKSSCH